MRIDNVQQKNAQYANICALRLREVLVFISAEMRVQQWVLLGIINALNLHRIQRSRKKSAKKITL